MWARVNPRSLKAGDAVRWRGAAPAPTRAADDAWVTTGPGEDATVVHPGRPNIFGSTVTIRLDADGRELTVPSRTLIKEVL
jgi:hypothetical protein